MSYNQKCVCEICTCGGHRCPKKHHLPLQSNTSYKDTYKNYPYQAPQNPSKMIAPKTSHYNPEDLRTSYKDNYIKYPYQNKNNQYDANLSMDNYKKNKIPFQGQSSYKKDYKNHDIPIEKNQPNKVTYRPNKNKFQGETTYKNTYITPPVQHSKDNGYIDPSQAFNSYQKTKVPFQGQSSYKQAFQKYDLSAINANNESGLKQRPQYKPTPMTEKVSSYKDQFRKYEMQKSKVCPIETLPPRPANLSPGKNHLNYQAQKKNWY